MSYNIYQNNAKKTTAETTTITLTDLAPATSYQFAVSETDGADESGKSAVITVTTNGRLTIPTTKEIVSVMFAENCIDLETGGFDTSGQFDGTVPVSVPIRRNTISGTSRVIEVEAKYHMNNATASLVTTNKYLIISGNKSIEITVK